MIHSDIRHRLEEREELFSPWAAKSRLSEGRHSEAKEEISEAKNAWEKRNGEAASY